MSACIPASSQRPLRDRRRLGIAGARMLAASLSVLALGGCATWSADGGFDTVQLVSGRELDKEATRIRTPEEAAAARERVRGFLAKPLNAESAVQIALLNNRGLQAAYSDLGIAETVMVEASLPPSPIFSVSRLASGGLVAEVERQIVVNILGLATLPQRSAIARKRFRQAQLAAARRTLEVAAKARRDFYRVAAAHQTVHLLERGQESASAGAELLDELGRTGAAPKIDQAREQAFYAELTAQLAQARLRHTQASEAMIRTLGLWGSDLERIKETGALPPLPSRPVTQADVETEALRRRLDLQIARLDLNALGQSLGLEQATRFVDLLELSGISTTEREEVIEHGESEIERTRLKGIEVEFRVPIFDFGETRIRRARETYLQAVHGLAEMGVNVRSEAREAYKTLRATYDIARLYRDEVVPLNDIITEEMTLRYTAMIEDVTDLLVITRSAIQANVAATEALRDYWVATVDLQMALAAGGGSSAPGAASVAAGPAQDGGDPH